MIVRVCLERGTDICTPKHVTSGAISALSITLQLRGTFDLFLLVNLTNRRITKLSWSYLSEYGQTHLQSVSIAPYGVNVC